MRHNDRVMRSYKMSFFNKCFFFRGRTKGEIMAEFITEDGQSVRGYGFSNEDAVEDLLMRIPARIARKYIND